MCKACAAVGWLDHLFTFRGVYPARNVNRFLSLGHPLSTPAQSFATRPPARRTGALVALRRIDYTLAVIAADTMAGETVVRSTAHFNVRECRPGLEHAAGTRPGRRGPGARE